MEKNKIEIRFTRSSDIPSIMDIEYTYQYPLIDEEELLSLLNKPHIISVVLTLNDKVVGYMVWEMFPTNYNLLRIIVHKQYRKLGLGSLLISFLKKKTMKKDFNKDGIIFENHKISKEFKFFLKKSGFLAIDNQTLVFLKDFNNE